MADIADLPPKITEFEAKVYEACKKIPKGKVVTYGTLATRISAPKACRAVGTALRKNPFAPEVPCHRVVASDLTLGGFNGSKGDETLKRKYNMLVAEGVSFDMPFQPSDTGATPSSRNKVKVKVRVQPQCTATASELV